MKLKMILTISVILSLVFLSACSEDNNPTGDGNGGTSDTTYFPSSNGNYYKYEVTRTDSTGSQSNGTRSSTFMGTQVFGGTTYKIKIDSTMFSGLSTSSNSYFRTTGSGVYFFLDTTGLSETIPDSLLQYLQLDAEMIAYSFPFESGKTWPVFKMNLNYLGIITITIVDVTAYYEGTENVTLNLNSGAVQREAAKVRYVLKLTVPDPNNPFQTYSSEFTARSWLVSGIGVVKWEGNGTVLNAFAGGGIDFDDTTSVVTQNLIDYSVN